MDMHKLLRSLLCTISVFAGTACAHAQLAAYANFEGSRFDQNSTWVKGGTFGVYDDFFSLGPVKLGADVRGSHLTGDNLSESKVLAGLRLAVKPPLLPIKPYIQASAGGVKLATTALKGSYHSAYEVNGGVDFTFFPHLDWRVVEVGAGSFGSSTDKNFHVSTGLVLRFF